MPLTPLSCRLWRLAVSYSERKLLCRCSSGNSFHASLPISTGAGTMAVDGGASDAEGGAFAEDAGGASLRGAEEMAGTMASTPPTTAPAGAMEVAAREKRGGGGGGDRDWGLRMMEVSVGVTAMAGAVLVRARGAKPAVGGGAAHPEQIGSNMVLCVGVCSMRAWMQTTSVCGIPSEMHNSHVRTSDRALARSISDLNAR
mmetsp:Transcript_33382/g.66430  ORF Transcript_33382/g.66430 Transcript_33382/m.66430 type:complete len:200 (+) Transcript_33382:1437-2036(+)